MGDRDTHNGRSSTDLEYKYLQERPVIVFLIGSIQDDTSLNGVVH